MRASYLGNLAVVTMVYDEFDFLPVWKKYYSNQVGPANCFIIDHGSSRNPIDPGEDFSILRLPRSSMNDKLRASFVSDFCSSLLKYYNAVIYTDIDEIIIVDPDLGISLAEFGSYSDIPVSSCFGLELIHHSTESNINLERKILRQRSYAVPHYSMMKPIFIRRAVKWGPGFHEADAPYVFEGLFNFHLASYDYETTVRRQEKRRSTPFSKDIPLHHHRLSDSEVKQKILNFESLPSHESATFSASCDHYRDIVEYMTSSYREIGKTISFRPERPWLKQQKWKIPERFLDAF